MIGLDTNVLVRYLMQDDAAQARLASAAIESAAGRGQRLRLTAITLCELVRVLESAYHRPRADVALALEQIVRTADFDLEHADHVRKAIDRYRSTPADFADALIGLVNEAAGCEHTLTFDRSLKRIPQFKVI
jgi:predicted nucleic-acid-binding protein